ncbi:hypothetical protein LVO39_004841 [Salmonella enterica]|uniref:DUF4376 domain-containing protein n=4 Tax=Salmonella enterica TaxID=28901 RepID=A0A765BWJ6_SALER|nr:hypothetical protein [Salmonella enterica]EBS4088769.1 hypothetical protein [Salmonella enterica subsp. enterica serovar Newport]EBW8396710.1 hypothetical protein [Salmonella enterica subsp. enterica serovar Florida]ECC9940254.1 hypothetical protein [Salmonella enterica subsp. enterica]EBG9726837.1 DUF4376 domain-containing protein [Salmonella enterica]
MTQAAETMNIGLSTLQRWLRQYRVKSGGTGRLAASCTNICDAIDQAMFTMGLQIHLRQREMKEEVDKLTDAQAVLDYVVGWPEGS